MVGASFTSYPSHSTSSIWRTDGTFQTEAVVENTADQNDVVTLKAFSQNGQSYVKNFPIAAGGLLNINLRQLQQDQVPDDSGRMLTDTSGIIQLVGSLHAQSKLSFDKIIHSNDEADYVGLPPQPCDYVEGIDMFLNGPGFGNGVPIMEEWDWAQAGAEDQAATGPIISSNTSIAQVTVNSSGADVVTFTWPKGGTSSVTLSYEDGSIDTTDCDACSGGDVPVEPDTVDQPSVTFSPDPATVAVGQTTTITASPSNVTGSISISISGDATVTPTMISSSEPTALIVKGSTAGSATLSATATNPDGGGTAGIGSDTVSVYTPTPAKLAPFSTSCAPTNGQGPLQVITNGNVVDCGGKVRASNFCGVNRNLEYRLVDQNGTLFASAYTISESFSNLNTTNTALGLPKPATGVSIPAGGAVTDAQFVGFTAPTCLATNDHHSYTQNFSVTANGVTYNLSTTVSISNGKFNGTAEDNVSITVP